MNRKRFLNILLPTILLVMLLGSASPAIACDSTHNHTKTQTYTFIAIGCSQDPGTQTVKDNILYVKGAVGVGVDYGYPWGDGTHEQTNYFYLNQTDYTGKLVGIIEKDFCRGWLKMIGYAEFSGVGYYTYHGPDITTTITDAQGNSILVELTDGMQLFGLIYTGGASGYGCISHHRVMASEKMSGVNIVGGALDGVGIVVGTGRCR